MQGFALRENIALFQCYSQIESDDGDRDYYRKILLDSRRKLALLEAARVGIRARSQRSDKADDQLTWLNDKFQSSLHPFLVLNPDAGLRIVGANEAFAQATMTSSGLIKGQPLFNVFPDKPGNPAADGVRNLYGSLLKAANAGQADVMPVQRYDMRTLQDSYAERSWLMVNIPIFDDRDLICLLHRTVDVTNSVKFCNAIDGPAVPSLLSEPLKERDRWQSVRAN